MSLESYFRLIRSGSNNHLIKPLKRVKNTSSDTDQESSNDSNKSFNEIMNEVLDETYDQEDQ